MDDTTWTALALVLTVLGGGYAWWSFRSRGVAAGLRATAIALLPPAAWATGTLEMFTRIVDAIVDWAVDLAFSPLNWAGIGLAGLAVVLYVVGGVARTRNAGKDAPARRSSVEPGGRAHQLPSGRASRSEPVIDPELAEIEALLKRRGIE